MPDSKDTGEKPWPTLYAERHDPGCNIVTFRQSGMRIDRNELETYIPLEVIRERLEAEADKLERPNEPGEDLTAATMRRVKAQGIRDALDATFSKEEGSGG